MSCPRGATPQGKPRAPARPGTGNPFEALAFVAPGGSIAGPGNGQPPGTLDTLGSGEVSEWLMVPLSKSGVAQVTGSSNLPLSASDDDEERPARLAGRFGVLAVGTVGVQPLRARW